MSALKEAELAGFDLSLMDESLRRSPEERLIEHQRALNFVLEFERAGLELRERAQLTSRKTDGR